MRLDKKTFNATNFLYLFAYFLLIFQSMTRWVILDGFGFVSKVCNLFIPIILLFVFLIRNSKIEKKKLLIIILLTMLTFISMKITDGTAIWNLILFIITSKGMNIDKIIKFDMITKLIMIFIIYILYLNGLTENVVIFRDEYISRYSFGFGHPNTFSVYLMSVCLDFLYLTFKTKYKKIAYLFLILSIIFIYTFCNSRSAIYTLTIVLIFSFSNTFIINNKVAKFLFSNLSFVFLFLSFLMTILYKFKNIFFFMETLNDILSNRVYLMYEFYNKYSISLFGNLFIDYNTHSTSTSSVLDNAYMLLLIKFGIIVTCILIFALSKRIKNALNENNCGLAICLTAFVFFGLMENGMIVLFYNPFLLFLSDLIFNRKKGVKTNEN